MSTKRRYAVFTYDIARQAFTPPVGVRRGPYSLWGLKRALRKLQGYGYPCNRSRFGSDPSVFVCQFTRGEAMVNA